jgi:hypothetical protein
MGFGLVIGYIGLLKLTITNCYSAIANSHTLLLTMAHAKSSMSSLGIAWQWILTLSSASVFISLPAGYSPQVLAACELHSLTADSRLYCSACGLLTRAQDLLPADPLTPNSKLNWHSQLPIVIWPLSGPHRKHFFLQTLC